MKGFVGVMEGASSPHISQMSGHGIVTVTRWINGKPNILSRVWSRFCRFLCSPSRKWPRARPWLICTGTCDRNYLESVTDLPGMDTFLYFHLHCLSQIKNHCFQVLTPSIEIHCNFYDNLKNLRNQSNRCFVLCG